MNTALDGIGWLSLEAIGNGAQQLIVRLEHVCSGIQQQEAAGAVGAFCHAFLETALSECCTLLIADHPGDGDGSTEERGLGGAEICGTVLYLRQHRRRYSNSESRSSSQDCDRILKSMVREALVASVVTFSAGKFPQQPAVDGAKASSPRSARAPRQGRCPESSVSWSLRNRVQQQSGFALNVGDRVLLLLELGAVVAGASVLPDNSMMDRCAG